MNRKRPIAGAQFLVAVAGYSSVPADEPLLPCIDRSLGAVSEVQLTQDIADVALNCADGQNQLICDPFVGVPLRDQLENLHLAFG